VQAVAAMPKANSREHHWSTTWNSPKSKYRNGEKTGDLHDRFPGPPCRTLLDMSEPEIVALELLYGCPVIRPAATSRA
jgi:hypothetical protein